MLGGLRRQSSVEFSLVGESNKMTGMDGVCLHNVSLNKTSIRIWEMREEEH